MDKITVPFECPNCHVQKKLKKLPDMRMGKMECPNCKTMIKLTFDITANPQTATASIIQPKEAAPGPQKNKKETQYGPSASFNGGQSSGYGNSNFQQTPPPFGGSSSESYGRSTGNSSMGGQHNGHTVVVDDVRNQRPGLNMNLFLNRLGKNGKRVVEKYQIYEGTITIGRQDPVVTSDIMYNNDPEMSRQSIQLSVIPTYQGVVCRLRVLKATNPVLVGNHTLVTGEEAAVNIGDTIRLGRTLLTISTT